MFFLSFILANVTDDEKKSFGNDLGELEASTAQGKCVVLRFALLFCSWVFSWLLLQSSRSPAMESFVTVAVAITK